MGKRSTARSIAVESASRSVTSTTALPLHARFGGLDVRAGRGRGDPRRRAGVWETAAHLRTSLDVDVAWPMGRLKQAVEKRYVARYRYRGSKIPTLGPCPTTSNGRNRGEPAARRPARRVRRAAWGREQAGHGAPGRLNQVAVDVRCDVHVLVARLELAANAGRRDWVPSWKAPRHR